MADSSQEGVANGEETDPALAPEQAEEEKIEKEEIPIAEQLGEVTDSIAFSTVDDLLQFKKITEDDGELLKSNYTKYHEAMLAIGQRNGDVLRRTRNLRNEILAEKIMLEKTRIEESDEIHRLRQMEDERDLIQKESEMAEQRDTLSKFELSELKRSHDDLTIALANMKKENSSIVEPVLAKLREEILNLNQESDTAKASYEKENSQKNVISTKLEACLENKATKEEVLSQMESVFQRCSIEPGRIAKQTESIENAANGMRVELKHVSKEILRVQQDTIDQADRKHKSELLKKSLYDKIDVQKESIEAKQTEDASFKAILEGEKAKNNDLITRKLELNLKKKESENILRQSLDDQNTARKTHEMLEKQTKLKRGIADETKQAIPTLESSFMDEQISLKLLKDEQSKLKTDLKNYRKEVDTHIVELLQQENLEQTKRRMVEEVLEEVENAEGEIVRLMAERKRQATLLGVLSAQRDIKARESSRVDAKEKEARMLIVIKEHAVLDLTKTCGELSNRFKEFSALYEVVKNERNKYVYLIQSSTQALAEMREKIRILQNEVEILGNESATKDKALHKERSAHTQAQLHRDSLRQEMNKYLSSYKEKRNVVEQQIQEIDKLNNIINSMEKQMLELKVKYEKAVEGRNITGVQLIDRNDELCIIYERSNQQLGAFKKGELELLSKEDELRLIRLQTEDIKRRYLAAQKRVPEIETTKGRIRKLEEKLITERKKTDELSDQLEDPKNIDRWRPLEGEDPSLEQLAVKLQVFEDRMDGKREQLLEKELILKEITSLTDKLRDQAISKRDISKSMADQLNSFQNRIRDTTKKMLASVSELSMYQATALRLQQDKARCEKLLEEASFRVEHGEAPSEEALKEWNRIERRSNQAATDAMRNEEEMMLVQPSNLLKTTAEPRPTAYIPEEMAIPKPYGNLAPFKPSEAGATMRHIKMPNPKQIEI